ncbi:mycofactocin biosynthesis glycosyltransferase MftF [Nocardia xishanensis]|uniref:mycofactocin biosynthesis glycosyltransferase MftF n=1 Tax=Nocardia xishanensis TaxID=238964 RepID=UPI00082C7110|nr:mycofactocin biosynthesis glycosyltransferase MftF [Nocardia xishanensis]
MDSGPSPAVIATVQLDRRTRLFRGGRVVLGGAPLQLLVLGPGGADRFGAWLSGAPVGGGPGEQALARRMLDAGIVHPVPGPGGFTNDDVTLVVPVKDNAAGIGRLLAASGGIPERIVVDDGSSPPLATATIRHDHPRGPAAARNSGWRHACTPLVAFLDSDTVPAAGWLSSVLPLFDDPAIAAVAPRVRSLVTGPLGRYEAERSSLDMGPEEAIVRPDGRVRYVPTAALVVRRDVLEAVGGFDETMRYGEDVDLVWRLLDAGHTIRYQPNSIVEHEPRHTVSAWLRQRFDYGTSAAPLAQRHPRLLHCAYLPASAVPQYVAAATGHPLVATAFTLLATARTAQRLHRRGVPAGVALSVAASGQYAQARQLADATRRVWWPAALLSRRGRVMLAATYLPPIVAILRGGQGPRGVLLYILDQLAYGLGVWKGCVRHRTPDPLLPRMNRSRKTGTDAARRTTAGTSGN